MFGLSEHTFYAKMFDKHHCSQCSLTWHLNRHLGVTYNRYNRVCEKSPLSRSTEKLFPNVRFKTSTFYKNNFHLGRPTCVFIHMIAKKKKCLWIRSKYLKLINQIAQSILPFTNFFDFINNFYNIAIEFCDRSSC